MEKDAFPPFISPLILAQRKGDDKAFPTDFA